MKHGRFSGEIARRPRAVVVLLVGAFLAFPTAAAVQDRRPVSTLDVSRADREQLLALIKRVDEAATGQVDARAAVAWSAHILRAAEGLAYVPFRVTLESDAWPEGRVSVYVRVSSKDRASSERSAMEKWLTVPPPTPRTAVDMGALITVPPGEMPVGGPALSLGRSQLAVAMQESFVALRLHLEQALKERQEQEAGRRPDESRQPPRDGFVYPFEDVDLLESVAGTSLERAIAVPPGEYVVHLAVARRGADPGATSPLIVERELSVPPFDESTLALSSVILASEVAETTPVPTNRQTAFPYVFGATHVRPADDFDFDDTENLTALFQILNPMPDPAGKPDVTVEYRFYERLADGQEVFFNETEPQAFNRDTLPPGFSLTAGHDVIALQTIPLEPFPGADYRFEIRVKDNFAGTLVTNHINLTVLKSPAALLQTAPALAPPFRKASVLEAEAVGFLVESLESRPEASAPANRVALDAARSGRFGEILVNLGAAGAGDAVATFLRGLALLALNDVMDPAAAQFRAALRADSDLPAAAFYLGACYAAAGRDREAVGAWQLTLATEDRGALVHLFAADAFMRLGEPGQAERLLREAQLRWPADVAVKRRLAYAYAASGRERDAVSLVDEVLQDAPADHDALFLGIRVLYSARVEGRPIESGAADADRFGRYVRAYQAAGGPLRSLVKQFVLTIDRRKA